MHTLSCVRNRKFKYKLKKDTDGVRCNDVIMFNITNLSKIVLFSYSLFYNLNFDTTNVLFLQRWFYII